MPFITFEGPEGAGKTTQVVKLAERLIALGHEVILTKEPGGTELGNSLRELTQDSDVTLSPLTLTLLFLTDRAHHLDTIIRPALERGAWVVCDRFVDSTIVYQGYGQGLDVPTLENFCQLVIDDAMPELTCLLLIDPEKALPRVEERAKRNGEVLSRFEKFDVNFHDRIYHGFLERLQQFPERIVPFHADVSREEVADNIYASVAQRFGLPQHVPGL